MSAQSIRSFEWQSINLSAAPRHRPVYRPVELPAGAQALGRGGRGEVQVSGIMQLRVHDN